MSAAPVRRVRTAHVEWLAERCSRRDWQIIETVNRLRLVTGGQLERLHFDDLAGHSRAVVRWRVLKRLTDWRVLMPLKRRIGGSRAGSSGYIFALDTAGRRLLQGRADASRGMRRPSTPGSRFTAHTLAVTELYVQLVEILRGTVLELTTFETEPACWWPDGLGSWIKPDAYLALASTAYVEHVWVEVDRAQEHLPTIRRKLMVYLDFLSRGQLGPAHVVPRVLLTVPSLDRQRDLQSVIAQLPPPAGELFSVELQEHALRAITALLFDSDERGDHA